MKIAKKFKSLLTIFGWLFIATTLLKVAADAVTVATGYGTWSGLGFKTLPIVGVFLEREFFFELSDPRILITLIQATLPVFQTLAILFFLLRKYVVSSTLFLASVLALLVSEWLLYGPLEVVTFQDDIPTEIALFVNVFYGLPIYLYLALAITNFAVALRYESSVRVNPKNQEALDQKLPDGTWIPMIPGAGNLEVDTFKLKTLAKSGALKPQTSVREVATGNVYAAKEIPGVFSDKPLVLTAVLSWFLGAFGVDRFYLGHIGLGLAKLFTAGGLGVWVLIDFILILMRKVDDSKGLPLS